MEGYIGEIRLFVGTYTPMNWEFCEGQLLSIAQNSALFAIIGNTYGGDGKSNFALPDMRGRTAANARSEYDTGTFDGTSFKFDLGAKGGTAEKKLNVVPNHQHTINSLKLAVNTVTTGSNANAPAGNYPGHTGVASDAEYFKTSNGKYMAEQSLEITVNTAGSGQPFTNMQAYTVLNYIICVNGVVLPRR
ncbi:MAG: tail fiber protein [Saprospiraceae bacterium]|nr:tail fiber protein [Saprospiraceae bacterium]